MDLFNSLVAIMSDALLPRLFVKSTQPIPQPDTKRAAREDIPGLKAGFRRRFNNHV